MGKQDNSLIDIDTSLNRAADGTFPPRILLGYPQTLARAGMKTFWLREGAYFVLIEGVLAVRRDKQVTRLQLLNGSNEQLLMDKQILTDDKRLEDGDFLIWKNETCIIYEEDPAATRNRLFAGDNVDPLGVPKLDKYLVTNIQVTNDGLSFDKGEHFYLWMEIQSLVIVNNLNPPTYGLGIYQSENGEAIPSKQERMTGQQLLDVVHWIRLKAPFFLVWADFLTNFPLHEIPDAYSYLVLTHVIAKVQGQEELLPAPFEFLLGLKTEKEQKKEALIWNLVFFAALFIVSLLGVGSKWQFSNLGQYLLVSLVVAVLIFTLIRGAISLHHDSIRRKLEKLAREEAINHPPT
jgi:hypothetical protein